MIQVLGLPFSLVCSQDVFQCKMDQILKDVQESMSTTNVITIHGHKEEEYDAHLCHLMQVTCKYGLMVSAEICNLKAESIMFFSCLCDHKVCIDPAKANAIADMPVPTSVKETWEF